MVFEWKRRLIRYTEQQQNTCGLLSKILVGLAEHHVQCWGSRTPMTPIGFVRRIDADAFFKLSGCGLGLWFGVAVGISPSAIPMLNQRWQARKGCNWNLICSCCGWYEMRVWLLRHSHTGWCIKCNALTIARLAGSLAEVQYIPKNMHTVLLCFALLWLCTCS